MGGNGNDGVPVSERQQLRLLRTRQTKRTRVISHSNNKVPRNKQERKTLKDVDVDGQELGELPIPPLDLTAVSRRVTRTWPVARRRLWSRRHKEPDVYYWSYVQHGEVQYRRGRRWSLEEHWDFVEKLGTWKCGTGYWGLFSTRVLGRSGRDCWKYWKRLRECGVVKEAGRGWRIGCVVGKDKAWAQGGKSAVFLRRGLRRFMVRECERVGTVRHDDGEECGKMGEGGNCTLKAFAATRDNRKKTFEKEPKALNDTKRVELRKQRAYDVEAQCLNDSEKETSGAHGIVNTNQKQKGSGTARARITDHKTNGKDNGIKDMDVKTKPKNLDEATRKADIVDLLNKSESFANSEEDPSVFLESLELGTVQGEKDATHGHDDDLGEMEMESTPEANINDIYELSTAAVDLQKSSKSNDIDEGEVHDDMEPGEVLAGAEPISDHIQPEEKDETNDSRIPKKIAFPSLPNSTTGLADSTYCANSENKDCRQDENVHISAPHRRKSPQVTTGLETENDIFVMPATEVATSHSGTKGLSSRSVPRTPLAKQVTWQPPFRERKPTDSINLSETKKIHRASHKATIPDPQTERSGSDQEHSEKCAATSLAATGNERDENAFRMPQRRPSTSSRRIRALPVKDAHHLTLLFDGTRLPSDLDLPCPPRKKARTVQQETPTRKTQLSSKEHDVTKKLESTGPIPLVAKEAIPLCSIFGRAQRRAVALRKALERVVDDINYHGQGRAQKTEREILLRDYNLAVDRVYAQIPRSLRKLPGHKRTLLLEAARRLCGDPLTFSNFQTWEGKPDTLLNKMVDEYQKRCNDMLIRQANEQSIAQRVNMMMSMG